MVPIFDDLADFPHGYYWYVQRWYDDARIPHYHGIRSDASTLSLAQITVKFNLIACPVDLVYGPCSVDDLMEYMADVGNVIDDGSDDIGTLGWLA